MKYNVRPEDLLILKTCTGEWVREAGNFQHFSWNKMKLERGTKNWLGPKFAVVAPEAPETGTRQRSSSESQYLHIFSFTKWLQLRKQVKNHTKNT
jgi:hypothetical protein